MIAHLSKSVTARLLKVIQETIGAGRIQMTDEEVVILYRDKIDPFMKTQGREPSINSNDPLERTQAAAKITVFVISQDTNIYIVL